jgi:uncharacterized protein
LEYRGCGGSKLKEYLLVDGYNIINSWPELLNLTSLSLEEARTKLIEIMANYQGYMGIKVIVVFDAHLVKGSQQKRYNQFGVEVIYTKEHQTADNYIEKRVQSFPRRSIVKVATSDKVEQQIILGMGAVRVSSRELLIDVRASMESVRKKYIGKDTQTNHLESRLDSKVLEKLERWRRQ